MTGIEIGLLAVVLLLATIYFGMHIGVALIVVSFFSVALLKTPALAARMAGAAANDSLSEYLFGVVPLFVFMGLLVSISGVGRDTFDVFEWLLRRVRGGLGVATVAANAVFAAITGISIASASVFTKVAVPEMVRHGYTPSFAVGVVAGSSVLGMLIPPSLLMIVYGVLAEESVGRMFLAGIVPGILLAMAFSLMIVATAVFAPQHIYAQRDVAAPQRHETWASAALKALPILSLVLLVLGGLYGGFFTPTEAGAMGALGALVITLLRRRLDAAKLWRVLVETGHISVSVLFLILAASLYSRMLALTGLPAGIGDWLVQSSMGSFGFMAGYIAVVVLLGCVIDSISIMLILLPIVLPVARSMGLDLIWFGVITVVAVEIGLLTPPFGISVYTVKAALDDKRITIKQIFAGVFPFVLCMLAVLLLLVWFPVLSTGLARL
jgi:tripartite ATP-independent transporter DctM subunit